MIRFVRIGWVVALAGLGGPVAAQEPSISASGPTPRIVRLGRACQIDLRVLNVSDSERPRVAEIAGVGVEVRSAGSQTQVVMDNRGTRRMTSVQWAVFLRPSREGTFKVPPIRVRVGAKDLVTEEFEFECIKDATGEQFAFFRVEPNRRRVYVHEPIRFDVEIGIDRRIDLAKGQAQNGQRFRMAVISAGYLTDLPFGEVLEEPSAEDAFIVLNQQLRPVSLQQTTRGTRQFDVYRFTRSFLPNMPGRHRLPESVLEYTHLIRPGDGFFTRSQTRDFTIYSEPIEVEVLPLPKEGRPEPFSGAVGRFTLNAFVDNRRVQVGDSIKLRVLIEGEGNTEFLEPPDLGEIEGFHLFGKKVDRASDKVTVVYDLTPLSVEADALPAIAYPYFDTTPGVERYELARTDSIQLEVRPAAEGETLTAIPGVETTAVTPGVDDIFDIEELDAVPPLATVPLQSWSPSVLAALVLLPWLLLGGLRFLLGRSAARRADTAGMRTRGAARKFKQALTSGAEPLDALTGYVADRLGVEPPAVIEPDLAGRLEAAGVAAELAHATQAAIEAGTAARYGSGDGCDAATAEQLVAQFERQSMQTERRRVEGFAGMLLCGLLAGASLAAPIPAQSDGGKGAANGSVLSAQRAYREGDYAAAARQYEAAVQAGLTDPRVLYNLGNAKYRIGQKSAALAAWLAAREDSPRNPSLLANIDLVERQLDTGSAEAESFSGSVRALRQRLTTTEVVWLTLVVHFLAAAMLLFGWRQPIVRGVGVFVLIVALVLTAELLWWGPNRPPEAVVIAPRVALVSEPRDGLQPVLKLREGVRVQQLGRSESWARVRVRGRVGYLPGDAVLSFAD